VVRVARGMKHFKG